MTDLALVTANRLRVVETLEQMTLPAAEAITAGMSVRIDTSTGKFTKANATTTAEKRAYGMATKTVAAGQAVTAVRKGVVDGYDISSLAYDAEVFLSDTDGMPADAAGTIEKKIATVIAGTSTTLGTAYDKLLRIDYDTDGRNDTLVVSSELVAASVDKWIFVADRPYQVTGVREIHSVVGGSGAVVRPRKVTAAGTAAPGDAAGATVKELTAADVGLETTINVSQSPTLAATAADLLLATGDKIGLNFGGTLTGLVGHIEIILKAL
ncbi:MAG: hypothetical protein ACOYYS_09980 [Chloroflexota bacterium]